MTRPQWFVLAVLGMIGGLTAGAPASTETMPVEDVTPGMRGTGVTVFHGTERSEFDVEILGVLTNSMGPQRNLILARLQGGPLAESGVIQGMSGSPVYIDDRLVGAVSYAMGSFSKDAIAGITPIDEMLRDAPGASESAARASIRLPLPLSTHTLVDLLQQQLSRPSPFATSQEAVQGVGLSNAEATEFGMRLHPIATPLVMSGFAPGALEYVAPVFRAAGLLPVVGGLSTAQSATPGEPLQAGDPVGVGLIQGDLSMAGTGTVTLVDGDQVYAFGHPFYSVGTASFPMTRATVQTILPSQAISSRIATVGETLGTINQDRATGIGGQLGPGPRMVPVRLQLDMPSRARSHSFNFQIASDDLFTPLLTYNAILSTLFSHDRQLGPATYQVAGRAELTGHPSATFEETFAGDAATLRASLYVAGPLIALLNNPHEPIALERIDLTITAHDEVRTATLERIWLDTPRPRAGETVPLHIAARTHQGEEILRTVMVDLPAVARGTWQIVVADGATLAQQERQQGGQEATASDLPQLINALNGARRNNQLYVQLRRTDAGAVVNGRRQPSLPPSVLDILGAESQGVGRLTTAAMREWNIPLAHVVTGARVLTLDMSGR